MKQRFELVVFGDQTFNPHVELSDLLRSRDDALLFDFLTKAYAAVRKEIFQLTPEARTDLPRFTAVEDLLTWTKAEKRFVPLDMALTCIFQLGKFIRQTNRSGAYPDPNASRILGLCTGALPAAAISCSSSVTRLIPFAVQTVVIAFKTGMLVEDAANRMEATRDNTQPWSVIVSHNGAAEALDRFIADTSLPLLKRPYISAHGLAMDTISGPPKTLALLRDSSAFKGLRSEKIPIYGPYHNERLFSRADVDELAGTTDNAEDSVARYHLLSGSGASTRDFQNFQARIKAAVEDILLRNIDWRGILSDVQTWLWNSTMNDSAATHEFKISAIGSHADQMIHSALKKSNLRSIVPVGLQEKTQSQAVDAPEVSFNKPKLAIIGMSGRFPGAEDNEAFWKLLYQGLDVHKVVPDLHWSAATHVDLTGKAKNTSATPYGCWLDNPADFDAKFFALSPREAAQMDPAQRLALMTAYESIEQAGLVPDATPSTRRDRVGVFYGVTSNDWMETNSAQSIDTYFIPGGNRAFIPGRINYFFKFSGPSYAIDTACSSSLSGIHMACNYLWRRDIDTAIAGGTNVLTNPDFTAGLDRGHFLSRTGNCKTFDDGADGYCRGEGIGTVIIKRLEDALADKDPILGVIAGASTNHSAESESITRPHIGAQTAIFQKILNDAMVDATDIGYVEMHGTGTQEGDAREMSSVLATFAPSDAKKPRKADQQLYLGSAKANIGHGEAASGVSSLIKVLLMMREKTIVPHCGIKTRINRKFPTDLEERGVMIASQATPWNQSPGRPRRAFVNNFSAAGGNSALLIEEMPSTMSRNDRLPEMPAGPHLVALSARSDISLRGNIQGLLLYLQQTPRVRLDQLAWTTTARRIHHQHRVMIAARSIDDLRTELTRAIESNTVFPRCIGGQKAVFAYTGNGAQYGGMGKELIDSFSVFKTEIQRLDVIGQSLGFPSVLSVLQSVGKDIGDFQPVEVQLATVCLEMALTKLLGSWGIVPVAVVGHSLGEYAALHAAKVLSDVDVLFLVGKRAELLQEHSTIGSHSMLVVNGEPKPIFSGVSETSLEPACINSPVETVLAGSMKDIKRGQELLKEAGYKTMQLKVPYAFHSAQVEPMLATFTKAAASVTYCTPAIPVICPLKASIVQEDTVFGPQYLAEQCRQPVNMWSALQKAEKEGLIDNRTSFLELGPHPAVCGMVKATLPGSTALPTMQRGKPVLQPLSNMLKTMYAAGFDIRWAEYLKDMGSAHRVLPLPAYSWDLKPYWMQYVNDWSLRKGDPPLIVEVNHGPRLESTTIHEIKDQSADGTSMIVQSNIARKDLSPLVQGHEVDGIPLCTPSVYADIALSVGTHLLHRHESQSDTKLVDVGDMTISKALILKANAKEQFLQAHVNLDKTKHEATIVFHSFDSRDKLQEHARCEVRFPDRSGLQLLQSQFDDIQQKRQALRDGIKNETTARFNRPMVYRMIRPLARFHEDYRAIDEVILNSKTLEASSKISFGGINQSGTYHTHPAVIDALTQSCGFAMNCNDSTDLDVEVFMNHGWGSFQIFKAIELDKAYTTYTKMERGENALWYGDIVIFEEKSMEIVAAFKKLAIQGVPRRVLKTILSMEQRNTQGPTKAPTPATKGSTAVSAAAVDTKITVPENKSTKALAIIAEESGIAEGDLTDNLAFSDAGVDSLMTLTISSRMKEELSVDVDFSSFFFDYPTVKDLKQYLGPSSSSASSADSGAESGDDASTPTSSTIGTPHTSPSIGGEAFDQTLSIVAEESGMEKEALKDDVDLVDCGVDSLMSLVIASRLRDEIGVDVGHDQIFTTCRTVADLRKAVIGDSPPLSPEPVKQEQPGKQTPKEPAATLPPAAMESDSLSRRSQAVESLVQKYAAGFEVLPRSRTAATSSNGQKVVMVTGATGSLGGHLAYCLAMRDDVSAVVCLNRNHRDEARSRQFKSMDDRGVHFPDSLAHKLRIYHSDSSKPKLGLADDVYEELAQSVSYIIHNAWPMSAKKPLAGFTSQFQVMRNLIDFASYAESKQSSDNGFTFQMVSSIGVVGHYGIEDKTASPIVVPEQAVDISSVLTNGYSEAKFGCERLLEETIRKHDRFRTMVVRLGQIAGSRTSGYWNPMEHFGFLIKSSQTLNALPALNGRLLWTPVNDVAGALVDLALDQPKPHPIYHIENPVGQAWQIVTSILADALHIEKSNIIPFEQWLQRVQQAPPKNNPALTLLDFLDDNFLRMSCGGLVLDTANSVQHSRTLQALGPVSEIVVRKYIHIWREIGFLASSEEDRKMFPLERVRLWGK